jgi:hypothetical protein
MGQIDIMPILRDAVYKPEVLPSDDIIQVDPSIIGAAAAKLIANDRLRCFFFFF